MQRVGQAVEQKLTSPRAVDVVAGEQVDLGWLAWCLRGRRRVFPRVYDASATASGAGVDTMRLPSREHDHVAGRKGDVPIGQLEHDLARQEEVQRRPAGGGGDVEGRVAGAEAAAIDGSS